MTSVETLVCSLLDAAGISCSASELEALVDEYAPLKQKIESFYAPAFADAEPLLVLVSDR